MNLRDEITRDLERTGSHYLEAYFLSPLARLLERRHLDIRTRRLHAELDALTPAEAAKEVA
jgi:hypothetical protein